MDERSLHSVHAVTVVSCVHVSEPCSQSSPPQLLSHCHGEKVRGKSWYQLTCAIMYLHLHINTSRHVISSTISYPFLHGCEIKAGVWRNGNNRGYICLALLVQLLIVVTFCNSFLSSTLLHVSSSIAEIKQSRSNRTAVCNCLLALCHSPTCFEQPLSKMFGLEVVTSPIASLWL